MAKSDESRRKECGARMRESESGEGKGDEHSGFSERV